MRSLVEGGYIEVTYKEGEISDVNMFSSWVNFFTSEERQKFLEDYFVLSALLLKGERAWERGQKLNEKIEDEEKKRTIADAVKFGIGGYKGMALGVVQREAEVLVDRDEVSDASFGVLARFVEQERDVKFHEWEYINKKLTQGELADSFAYVEEVYEAMK